jgi:A nuclease of the HNH/ENDO VII superfamily with conserved WHH
VNTLVALTWGRMVMDPTDLIALPMVGLAAAWMLRSTRQVAPAVGRGDFRRALDFAAVIAVGIASIASVGAGGGGGGSSQKSPAQPAPEEEETPPDPSQVKQAELAQKLLLIDLQSESIAPLFAGQEDLKAQHDKLIQHIAHTTTIVQGVVTDPSSMRAAEVGIDLAGIAYDLMRGNREAWGRGLSNRKEIESEANYALIHYIWPGMDKLKADPKWAQASFTEANELISKAASHRDNILAAASVGSIMSTGVQAASIVSLAASIPRTLVAGQRALTRISDWMKGLQIETASLQFAGVPGAVGSFQIVSTAGTLALGIREVTFLAEAGKISVTALDLYIMAKGASHKPPPAGETGQAGPTGETSTTPTRNAALAGKKHPVTGVPFDSKGFPDFKAAGVVKAEVKITLTGSRRGDVRAANQAAGFAKTPKDYTWHHHQDGTTMQLVPKDIHKATGHTGGYALGR